MAKTMGKGKGKTETKPDKDSNNQRQRAKAKSITAHVSEKKGKTTQKLFHSQGQRRTRNKFTATCQRKKRPNSYSRANENTDKKFRKKTRRKK
jgi:hypothetical protein